MRNSKKCIRYTNFLKSVNKTFSSSFLISERDKTVQLKIRGLKLSDQLLSEIKDEHCLEKIRARRKNILNLVAYNLDFI
jgi:hypothetical protein